MSPLDPPMTSQTNQFHGELKVYFQKNCNKHLNGTDYLFISSCTHCRRKRNVYSFKIPNANKDTCIITVFLQNNLEYIFSDQVENCSKPIDKNVRDTNSSLNGWCSILVCCLAILTFFMKLFQTKIILKKINFKESIAI